MDINRHISKNVFRNCTIVVCELYLSGEDEAFKGDLLHAVIKTAKCINVYVTFK